MSAIISCLKLFSILFSFLFFFLQKTFNEQIGEFYAFVGRNYYIEYEVKVQAFNFLGPGPNSTISNVYSAEGSEYTILFQSYALFIIYYLSKIVVAFNTHHLPRSPYRYAIPRSVRVLFDAVKS